VILKSLAEILLTAKPLGVIDGIDMQHTGEVRKIDSAAIKKKLDNKELVVISPIGYSPTGEVFNLDDGRCGA